MEDPYVQKSDCNHRHEELMSALNRLSDRLYRDNGHKSIQSCLNDHERILRVLIWVVTVAGGAFIVGAVGILLRRLL